MRNPQKKASGIQKEIYASFLPMALFIRAEGLILWRLRRIKDIDPDCNHFAGTSTTL